jgi:hypothetical protein
LCEVALVGLWASEEREGTVTATDAKRKRSADADASMERGEREKQLPPHNTATNDDGQADGGEWRSKSEKAQGASRGEDGELEQDQRDERDGP